MTQRRRATIKQGAVTDVMSCLSELPERGKAPDKAVSLTEIFRTKEYIAEIKRALKKGYTFDDLAAIFSERCGVNVSARQLISLHPREKQEGEKQRRGEIQSSGPAKERRPAGQSSAGKPRKRSGRRCRGYRGLNERSSNSSEIRGVCHVRCRSRVCGNRNVSFREASMKRLKRSAKARTKVKISRRVKK